MQIEYSLSQNYPNPFNPTTTIKFGLPLDSKVVLNVYNTIGQKVATLENGELPVGNYSVNFNASNLSSGVYIYIFNAGSFNSTKKFVLLK